jgi:hypothetical protein
LNYILGRILTIFLRHFKWAHFWFQIKILNANGVKYSSGVSLLYPNGPFKYIIKLILKYNFFPEYAMSANLVFTNKFKSIMGCVETVFSYRDKIHHIFRRTPKRRKFEVGGVSLHV